MYGLIISFAYHLNYLIYLMKTVSAGRWISWGIFGSRDQWKDI